MPSMKRGFQPLDANLILRASSTNLTATETVPSTSGLDMGKTPVDGGVLLFDVPAAGGTSPTLDISLEYYDGSSWVELFSLPQITAIARHQLFGFSMPYYSKIRVVLTVGGTSPNFGGVLVAYVPRGM